MCTPHFGPSDCVMVFLVKQSAPVDDGDEASLSSGDDDDDDTMASIPDVAVPVVAARPSKRPNSKHIWASPFS